MVKKRIAFKSQLLKGKAAEYQRRHNALWPEMRELIRNNTGSNYSIFVDAGTDTLFGYVEIEDEAKWSSGGASEVCRRWWDYMADIMETNPDNSPVSSSLKEVFHLD